MEIELVKSPYEYRKFSHTLLFDKDMEKSDVELFASKICGELSNKTKVKWHVETCVGGKCVIETKIMGNRKKRKQLKGQVITIENSYIFK